MATLAFISALFPLIAGILALVANKTRLPNQLFFISAVFTSAAGLCIAGAFRAGEAFAAHGSSDATFWIRGNAICGYFIPSLLVMTREAIYQPTIGLLQIMLRTSPWLAIAIILGIAATTEAFLPADSTHITRTRGWAYYGGTSIFLLSYGLFLIQTYMLLKKTHGAKRLELRFLIFTTGSGIALFVVFALAGNVLSITVLKTISVFIIPITFCITAWSICYYRIFEPKQMLIAFTQHLATATAGSLLGIFTFLMLRINISTIAAAIVAMIAQTFALPIVGRLISDAFRMKRRNRLIVERRSIIQLARVSTGADDLLRKLEGLLRIYSGASWVTILERTNDTFSQGSFRMDAELAALPASLQLSWITPEAVERRTTSASSEKLKRFLSLHSLGLLLTVPQGSQMPALVIAFGRKLTESPFTYPEIERLHNLAELMDNLLVRSLLVEQAALQAKMEHLSMLSRGLAHDLKNLITPVSSFLVYSENKLSPGTVEAEVHTAARHAVKVMTEYVREAMFFAEKLEPRFESIDATRLCVASAEVVGARALARGVALKVETVRGGTLQADAVLIQRMLSNLAANAIDASPAGASVRLTVTTPTADRFAFHVIDQGTGIAPEHLHRVFDAYFTTKEFGDQTRGFGLGLTIAQKIAHLHGGTITVQSRLGQGTTMIVDLPTSQPDTAARTHARNEPATTPSA